MLIFYTRLPSSQYLNIIVAEYYRLPTWTYYVDAAAAGTEPYYVDFCAVVHDSGA